MDIEQSKKQIIVFIVAQTIANENLEVSHKFLRWEFEKLLNNKLGSPGNRKEKKRIETIKKNQLVAFDKIYKDYIRVTTKMIKHFDEWESSEIVDSNINKLYSWVEQFFSKPVMLKAS